MKPVALALLLLLAVAAAEEVSLNKALQLALVEYPEMDVQPQSRPQYLAQTNGSSYWIIEFDQVWVPISREGEVMKAEQGEITAAYRVHYALSTIISQRDTDDYPTKKESSLTLLLGDVDSKETYLVSYQAQLPFALRNNASKLVTEVGGLKSAIESSLDAITDVRTSENEILFNTADYSDFEGWRSSFSAMLSAMQSVATKGYAYDDARTAFNLQAQIFLNSSNDTAAKQTVQAFVSGIAISNIPGSLPGLESTVRQWKDNWLDVALTDEKVGAKADELYTVYREFYSGETVKTLRDEAYSKVQALATTVPLLLGDLSGCSDGLTPKQQGQLDDLNDTYTKASERYTAGAAYEKALDDAKAKEAYQNAISWAEDAKAAEAALADVECPAATATPKPSSNPLDFITSPLGLVAIGLAVALGALYWWNNRKKGEGNEAEYVPSY